MPEQTDSTRAERLEALRDFYGGDHSAAWASPADRYIAVDQSDGSGEYTLSGFDTMPEAFAYLGEQVLDRWEPEAVYDLETGERIALHVASPVVSRAAEGSELLLDNPLDGAQQDTR